MEVRLARDHIDHAVQKLRLALTSRSRLKLRSKVSLRPPSSSNWVQRAPNRVFRLLRARRSQSEQRHESGGRTAFRIVRLRVRRNRTIATSQ